MNYKRVMTYEQFKYCYQEEYRLMKELFHLSMENNMSTSHIFGIHRRKAEDDLCYINYDLGRIAFGETNVKPHLFIYPEDNLNLEKDLKEMKEFLEDFIYVLSGYISLLNSSEALFTNT